MRDEENTDYRQAPRVCPACGTLMELARVFDASVDLCGGCGGAWFDWFDGDLSLLSKKLADRSSHAPSRPAVGVCPDCGLALHAERVFDGTVHRCGSCIGTFVTKIEMAAVARVKIVDESLASEGKPGAFARLLAAMRHLGR